MRAFVRLRKLVAAHKDLTLQLEKLEQNVETHDRQIQAILEAIRQLMKPSTSTPKQIGFRAKALRK